MEKIDSNGVTVKALFKSKDYQTLRFLQKRSFFEKNAKKQRQKDFAKILDLCKYSESYIKNATCELVEKKCNIENCPLFFCTSLDDCDIAADIIFKNS